MGKVKKGLALIIANAEYQSQPKLPSCCKDGVDMKFKLEQLTFMYLTMPIQRERSLLMLLLSL